MTSRTETASGPRAALMAASPQTLVRWALGLDAVVTGANGIAYLALAGVLADPLGVSEGLLRGIGAFLVVFALAVAGLARSRSIPAGAVAGVVVVNGIWAVDSIAALALGWVEPETLGGIWIALQAIVVGAFAALQYAAQRAATRATA